MILVVALFATISFSQVSGGGQVGGGSLLVPISLDDPYSIDKNFVTSLVADLYGEQFNFASSMLWIGEHFSEDLDQPRNMGLTHRQGDGTVLSPGDVGAVWFEEVFRSTAFWVDSNSGSGVTTYYDGTPFAYVYEEHSDIVAGWVKNDEGVDRLVVGLVAYLYLQIDAPVDGMSEFVMERFYPIKRFYNEGQAAGYADDIARMDIELIDASTGEPVFAFVSDGTMDCSVYSNPIQRDFCACLNTIAINFNQAMGACPTSPDIGDMFQNGAIGAAGGAFGGGLLAKAVKRLSGPWTALAGGVLGAIGGAGTTYGVQYAQCVLSAKSARDAARNHAGNEYDRVKDGDNGSYQCPIGAQ